MPEPDTSDKNDVLSTASTKPRASDASPPGPLQAPAAIADGGPSPAATADRNLAAENAEVEAILDEWTRGPPTPQELRRTIKRARSTSDARDSPTP